jgi:lysozyme family protein
MILKLLLKKRIEIFPNFVSLTIGYETGGDKHGGYTNDPVDPGGETRWGISKKSHPTIDIKNLTYKEATEIYKNEYFSASIETLALTHPNTAFKVFDMGVLRGPKTAVKALQRTLNDNNLHPVRIDGEMGVLTIGRIISMDILDSDLLRLYIKRLEKDIFWLTALKPWLMKYKAGWLSRIHKETNFESKIK